MIQAKNSTDAIKEKVFKIVEDSWSEEIDFLKNLITKKSTLLHEEDMQLTMARKMKQLGLVVDTFDIDISKISTMKGYSPCDWSYRNRPIVVGTLYGKDKINGKSLVLNGHADVVSENSTRHWTYDPWEGTIVGNKMYGRGSSDMKCGLAAIIYAISAITSAGINLKGDVIVQSVIEEEASGNGTLACLEKGYVGDAVLVAECTDNKILTTSVGSLWLRVVVDGLSGHVTSGTTTTNAIEKAYEVIKAFRVLEDKWNSTKHPAYESFDKPIRFNVGKISGGDWPSSVPSECEFHIRLAIYPDIDPLHAQKEVESFLRDYFKDDDWFSINPPKFYWYANRNAGFDVPKENPFFDVIKQNHRGIHKEEPEYSTVTAGNDMRFYALYTDIPVTMYGGYGYNMHAANEYVDLPSIKDMTKLIAGTIIDWCKLSDI
jgi:acetylornithine deacetylase